MSDAGNKQLKLILEYNTNRQYFGLACPGDVNAGYRIMRKSQVLSNPVFSHKIKIGNINGNVICDALWYEMSYNPGRFGCVSPFVRNGRNQIYRFCSHPVFVTESQESANILMSIRHHLIEYMKINGATQGLKHNQWYDVIETDADGCVYMRFIDGHSGPVLKMLGHLRDCIKLIAKQNVADIHDSRFCPDIMRVVSERHPDGNRPICVNTQPDYQTDTNEQYMQELAESRYDDMQDNLQITLDNRGAVSRQQYNQARYDLVQMLQSVSDRQI